MKKLLLTLFILVLLSGCNTNINDELKRFCVSKGYDCVGFLKNFNYEDTSVQCISTSYLGFKTDKKAIFDINCQPTTQCLKANMWGDCSKQNYNYTCKEI